jgi:Autoinducer binding domain
MPESRIMEGANIDRSAIRLTDTILCYDEQDLSATLKAIASEIGVRHIVHLRLAPDKRCEASLPTAIATYSKGWQTHYFLRGYEYTDPVVAHGRNALLPFDWETLASDDDVLAFFADAAKHGVGRKASPSQFGTEGVSIRWFPSPAIIPRPSGLNLNAKIWLLFRSFHFLLISPRT